LLLFKQTVDILIFQYTAAVDFIQKPVQTASTQRFMLKFTYQSSIANFELLTVTRGVKLMNIELTLECGPMPNVMAALPNIGGTFCSTPQSLADAHY